MTTMAKDSVDTPSAGIVGWCVPDAIAALTGMSREQAWLEILADRHDRRRRLLMLPGRLSRPHGGGHAAEAIRVIQRAGYTVTDLWAGTRRMTVANFLHVAELRQRELCQGMSYLILQQGHLAYLDGEQDGTSRQSLVPGFPIAKTWQVARAVR